MNKHVYAVIGGDERYWIIAKLIANAGNTVFAAGFDIYEGENERIIKTDALTAAAMAENVILPLPPIKDGININAPYSSRSIRFDDNMVKLLKHAEIYTGFAEKLKKVLTNANELKLRDYSRHEQFLMRNAHATAEAAVMLAIEKLPKVLSDSTILITGCGRIGKYAASMLRALGANVFAASRSNYNISLIKTMGVMPVTYGELKGMEKKFDLLINTADAMVIDEKLIRELKAEAVIIDLASYPGGTDFEAAKECGIDAVHALGLPGKYSPETAAEIIWSSVVGMKEEEHS